MSAHDADVQKQVKTYKLIFGALAVFTLITVAVSTLHLPLAAAIAVALLIASVKGSLVAGWFMHLRSDRKVFRQLFIVGGAGAIVLYLVVLTSLHVFSQ